MKRTTRIAVAQIEPRIFELQRNLSRILEYARRASEAGADLVVFPEAAVSGYCFDSLEEALPYAEDIPGHTTSEVTQLCRERGIWVVVGLLEKHDHGLFNTAVLLGPGGVLGLYRKIHLPCLGVDRFATPGEARFQVHETPVGRIGMNICYDAAFPESSRILALEGAEIIVLPTNWPEQAFRYPRYTIPTRAQENVVYYAACNRVGEERGVRFLGHSIIANTLGDPVVEAGRSEGIFFADLDIDAARRKRWIGKPGEYELDRIGDRRPEMYGRLVEK